jgi:hypothetical protein
VRRRSPARHAKGGVEPENVTVGRDPERDVAEAMQRRYPRWTVWWSARQRRYWAVRAGTQGPVTLRDADAKRLECSVAELEPDYSQAEAQLAAMRAARFAERGRNPAD